MGTGTWEENNRPKVPGWYNRFKNKAVSRLAVGQKGILGLPVKANWGPAKMVVNITVNSNAEKKLKQEFGEDENYTATRLGKLALLGGSKEIMFYRLCSSSAAQSSVVLKDSLDGDLITLKSKYPTTRDFNVTIKSNVSDESKLDILFFEGSEQLFSMSAISGTPKEIVEYINNNSSNEYVTASTSATTGTLATVSNAKLTGGNDGCEGINSTDYIEAMEVLEGYEIEGFVTDGITDQSLQNTIKTWVQEKQKEGINIIAYLGAAPNEELSQSISRAKELNYEGCVYCYTDGCYNGEWYTANEVAVYIASLATGQGLTESLCSKVTIFEDVRPRLGKTKLTETLEAGVLTLSYDAGDIIVTDDVNTFKNYTDEKTEVFGNIRAIKFMYAVDTDTAIKRRDFNGQVPNDDTGRALLISSLKQYFETLNENRVITDDFTVEIDKDLQESAESDEVFWRWDAKYVEVMKRIYGTGNVTK